MGMSFLSPSTGGFAKDPMSLVIAKGQTEVAAQNCDFSDHDTHSHAGSLKMNPAAKSHLFGGTT